MDSARIARLLEDYVDPFAAVALDLPAEAITRVVHRLTPPRKQQVVDHPLHRPQYPYGRLDLAELVRGQCTVFWPGLEAAGLILKVRGVDEPAWAYADRALMEMVVAEMFENARRHVRPGARVLVGIYRLSPDPALCLSVADRGAGFGHGNESRIFEKGFRGPGGSLREGRGIGLARVREIVHQLGGRIHASNGRHGASFSIELLAAPRPWHRVQE